MRILHIISQKPDFTGSGKYVQEMIRQGQNRGHESFLLAGTSPDYQIPTNLIKPDAFRVVHFDGQDLPFPVVGMSDVMPYTSTICSTLTHSQISEYKNVFAKAIGAAVKDLAPDLIHSNHLWMATAVARQVAPHLPLVTTSHGSCLRQHSLCSELGQSLGSSLRHTERIIALFQQQKHDIVQLLDVEPSKVEIISGGYNEECFYFQEKTGNSPVQLLYAGKLDASKGVPWLLRSLKKIHEPWLLHLVGAGSGAQQDLCLELAQSHEGRVMVHGLLSHEQLGKLMRQSHIFVLPSFFEGLPLVLLEAMACGCRIVSTDLPGVRELFTTPHPHMVRLVKLPKLETVDQPFQADEPFLEEQLAQAIRAAMTDIAHGLEPDQEYIRQITEPFTWKKIFLKVEAVYNQVLKEK